MSELIIPPNPEYGAEWRPIYFSPVPGSGERIVVAIAIRGIDGQILVDPILDSKRLKCMFGTAGDSILSKIEMLTKHARTALRQRMILDSSALPLSGFYLGDFREALDHNIEGVFKQAILMSTGLGSQLVIEQDKVSKKNDHDNKKWVANIKGIVKEKKSELAGLFDREVVLRNGKLKGKVGFLSTQYGAEFGRINLSPNAHLQSRRMAQAKLWQLDQLRDDHNLDSPEFVELIIGHTNIKNLSQIENEILIDDLDELSLEAKSREIGLFSADSANAVAKHIFEQVA